MTEGMRRLGIVTGALASITWFFNAASSLRGATMVDWLIFLASIPIVFGLGFLVIWTIHWVIEGFRAGTKR